ncbi:hypothetical protein ACX0HA_07510 [Flavobacterium hauense]
MKTRLLTIALLLAVSLSGFAQDKASLTEATKRMIALSQSGDFDAQLATIYPGYFNVVPKDDYMKEYYSTMRGKDYAAHIRKIDPSIDYGALEKANNGTFCVINYDRVITISLENKLTPQEISPKKEYFKKLFKTDGVYYITETNTFDIKKRVQVVAIADEASNMQWTFLDPLLPGADKLLSPEAKEILDPENITQTSQTSQKTIENDKNLTEDQKNILRDEAVKRSLKKKS